MKEGEGISQRTYMRDPWTQTVVWGLPEGLWWGLGGGGRRGKSWENCNNINNKI